MRTYLVTVEVVAGTERFTDLLEVEAYSPMAARNRAVHYYRRATFVVVTSLEEVK